ncbi:HAD family phosphatase [Candidatus Woesearchaeota archaeon]|nr:HAD family phosphatase [Candidatus Woesearchaeota archaeon]
MTITTIIFDLDGTLIDSVPAHKNVIRGIAAKHGIKITEDDFARFNGMSAYQGFKQVLHKHHLQFGLCRILWERTRARKDIMDNITLYPATTNRLQTLQKHYAMAVATSSSRHYLKKIMKRYSLQDYFSACMAKDDVNRSKPAPDIFLKAAKRMSKSPEQCVVIEDSLNGIIAAKRAGMAAIALLTTTKKALFKSEAAPDLFLKDLSELDKEGISKAESKAYIRRQIEEETP